MKMTVRTRKAWLCTAALLLIAVGIVFGILGLREYRLNENRNEALAELEARRGEYDERSIVLGNTTPVEARKLAERFGAELRITEDGKFAALRLPEGTTILDVYADEANNPYIADMQADYAVRIADNDLASDGGRTPLAPDYTVSDPLYRNQGYLNALNLGKTWHTTRGAGVTVAVIDTGIDTDHPEFAGKISEYSYNATEDKIVKDYLSSDGWSLIEDEQGHGTAVAGVIAAQMNGAGTVGIAPEVDLIVIKAECDESGNFERTSDLVFALYYAIERDADVVNMSFGATGINVFAEATQLALDSDVICVAAAGNDATTALTYPAADERVFGVGALEDDGRKLASYSNYGENVNLVAPSTVYTSLKDGGYGVMNGTSFSAPIVTAAVALYLSQNRYTEFVTVRENLYASCADLGSLGEDFIYGYGALDVSAFVLGERGTVTFHMLTDELENIESVFVRGVTLQDIPEPERLYAVFDGWYYDAQCTEEYRWYEDVFTGDLTLYAKWANEDDGVPYTYVVLDDGTVEIRSYTGKRRFITIPDKIDGRVVSGIGDEAFYGQSRLRRVTLPASLRYIGRSAFEGCLNLADISIPATVETVGDRAFYGLTRLYAVIFEGDKKLTEIGDFAFAFCGNLEKIELPSSLQSVNGSAFCGATALEAISVRKGNPCFASKDGVLFNGTASELVAYPAGKRGEYAVPSAVRRIGDYAFGYALITSVDLQNVTQIGESAFTSSRLTAVSIPDSVTAMGSGAFAACTDLKSVSLGRGLKSIADGAFRRTALTQITVPNGIEMIGAGAFLQSTLKTVAFEAQSNLKMIGDSAFCESYLESIAVPASVFSIESGAFMKCYALSSVIFEDGSALHRIGASAFAENRSLVSISLPGNLREIGEFAFLQSGLTGEVTVPALVEKLGAGAFGDCDSLTAIRVASGNTFYKDIDGVVFTADEKTAVAYPAGNQRTAYTVKNGVETVGKAAFLGADRLNSVELPASLTTLEDQAFSSCANLSSLNIPDNVVRIGRKAFSECWSLYSIRLNDTSKIDRIGYEAFAYCGITGFRIPPNVSTVAQGAFLGCKNLYSVTFARNSKLESISAYMFDGCTDLQNITFEPGSALTSIQAHGLEGMRKLTSIDFGGAKLTNIDNFAFRFCESLQTVKLPDTVTNIGRFAFYECRALAELTVPASVEHIGRYAFWGTKDIALYFKGDLMPLYLDDYWDEGAASYAVGTGDVITSGDWKYAVHKSGDISIIAYLGSAKSVDLTSLDLGGKIIAIGGKAFDFSDVESVILPNTLNMIQAEAFYGTKLKSIVIPKSVSFIGREAFADTPIETLVFEEGSGLRVMERHAFAYTKSLQSVTLPASLEMMGVGVFEESGLASLSFASGFALTELPERAFAGTNLQSVMIPDCVTLINHGAFRDCLKLTSVTLGGGKDLHIASNAFYNTGLTGVHIPANVSYIGEYAFVGLRGLGAFTVSADNPYYAAVDGLLVSKDGKKLIAVPAGRSGSLTVPAGVEIIGFGAFENSALSAVHFDPNGNILTFGYRAFYAAKNIKTVTVPKSVVSIDYYAFANCTALESVIFAEGNDLKGIYEGAFYGCKSLSSIVLPDSIVEISDFAFYGCSKITKIPVSATHDLQGIYSYAFAYTGIAGELTLPETLIDIGDYAFAGTALTDVTVPDTNKEQLVIGLGAFAGCNKLESITVPFIGAGFEDESVTWFGYIFGAGAYEANPTYVPESLKKVTVTEGISFVGEGGFYNLACLREIDVPHSVTVIKQRAFYGTAAKYELTNTILALSYYTSTAPDNYIAASETFGKGGLSGNLVLADGMTEIGGGAFRGCADLLSVTIPDSVTIIGSGAFSQCSNLTTLAIPDSVTSIGSFAFSFCSKLTKITLPDGITSIADGLFQYCSKLESITIPDGVTSIGKLAFERCVKLESITIPVGVTSIGDGVFDCCESLKNVTIPDGVTSIGKEAFRHCRLLTDITLPSKLTFVGQHAFNFCESLYVIYNNSDLLLNIGSEEHGGLARYARLIVDKNGNRIYKEGSSGMEYIDTADGFRFIKENDAYQLIAYLGTEDTVTLPVNINGQSYEIYKMMGVRNVIIPDGLTSIGENAFYSCKTLESIEISDSVKSIGFRAFYECEGLTSITIPDGITSIGVAAFQSCSNLENVIISDSVTSLGSSAFSGCGSLKSVKLSARMTAIDLNTFEYCSKLENVTIPGGVTSIYSRAFEGCTALSEVILPDGLTFIGDGVFSGCNGLLNITIPKSVNYLGGSVFSNCPLVNITVDEENEYLSVVDGILYDKDIRRILFVPDFVTDICIPRTVTDISSAFYGHKGIQTVTFESGSKLTSIGRSAFVNCSNLKSITIPEGVTSIGMQAFFYCTNLTDIHIPDGVTVMEYGAFEGCSGLTSITLPDGMVNIGDIAFRNCSNLLNVTIPDTVSYIGDKAFFGCQNLNLSVGGNNGCYTCIDGVLYDKNVTKVLFVSASVTEVCIPDTVTDITSAFMNHTGVQKVAFESGSKLTDLPEKAFYGCGSLKDISIPYGVTSIGSQAFWQCGSLENVTFPDGLTHIGNGAFFGCAKIRSIAIPEGVTRIEPQVFSECTSLASVTIPSTVTVIDYDAFRLCEFLYAVYNKSNLQLSIGSADHGGIASYAKAIYNGNTDAEYYIDTADGFRFIKENDTYKLIAYLGNEETVTLPQNINGNPYEIYRMRGVRNVIIPEGVTHISEYAFFDCDTLISVVIPEGVTHIATSAFYNCRNLENFTIPNTVTNIGNSAFQNCSSLTSVTFSDGLNSIEDYAFENCDKLASITLSDSVTSIGRETFLNTAYYNNSDNWKNGALYIGKHLIKINEEAECVVLPTDTKTIGDWALDGCYKIKKLTLGGSCFQCFSALTNLETLVITEMPTHKVVEYFGYYLPLALTITLKNIVLTDGVSMHANAFNGITGVTIYVEATKLEARHWDENFPNWHNGNKVVYGDDWITAEFFGVNGELVSSEIYRTAQVIRQPYYTVDGEGIYAYDITWDIDGDGVADMIPATSSTDITARAIASKYLREYTVNFLGVNGEILSSSVLHYGDTIPEPGVPSAKGYTFKGWLGYAAGMTVSEDMNIGSSWTHAGGGHSYRKTTVAPGCTDEGYDLHTCSVCGHSYSENKVPAKGHSFGEWVIVNAPTCADEGTRYRTCVTCGAREDGVAPANGHDYTAEQIKAPTCTEAGEIRYTCSCGHVTSEQTALAPHSYEKKTCAEPWLQLLIDRLPGMFYGYEGENVFYFECADCKHVQTMEESAKSHSASISSSACTHVSSDWTVAKEESCTEAGIEWKSCLLCESLLEARTFGEPQGHVYGDELKFNGTEHWRECVCGDKTEISQHTLSDWKVCIEPTCTEKGEEEKLCATCAYREAREIPANGHDHKPTVTAPTCTEKGYTTHTCHCGDSYIDTYVDPTGHFWDSGVITLEPTYDAEGVRTFTCTVCKDRTTEPVDRYTKTDKLTHSDSGIRIEVTPNGGAVINSESILTVENREIPSDKATYKKLKAYKKLVGRKPDILAAYDISLVWRNAEVQPGGEVAVTLPKPADPEKYKNITVVFVDDAGNITFRETTVNADGTVTFLTDHFSYYAIVGKPAVDVGLIILISAVALALAAGGLTAFVLVRKKRSSADSPDEADETDGVGEN